MTPDELLERARQLFHSAEAAYRDSLLQVGRILHEFVLAYLHESDGGVSKRTRRQAIFTIMGRLGVSHNKVNYLISAAMVVELLSEGGDIGGLGWNPIARFSRFIQRNRIGQDAYQMRKNGLLPSAEEWVVKPKFDGAAQDLFRRAVRENLTTAAARAFVLQLDGRTDNGREARSRVRMTRERQEALDVLRSMATAGNPRDVAEVIFEAVKESEDPRILAAHLQQLVNAMPKKQKRLAFADAS
jgi:hypothetical protein